VDSPYQNLLPTDWYNKTLELIKFHPLNIDEIVEVVIKVWNDIFSSSIGSKPFKIGKDLFPAPQIMGFFLHELIPLELEYRYPTLWRKNRTEVEKDIVYISDNSYSIELKTSSSTKNIFGNRSYAQMGVDFKKNKSGYYLAINFEKFSTTNYYPQISLIRFGWLDYADWKGQQASTGQQARLSAEVEKNKLITLFTQKK
jgi:hypothetical protein